MSILGGVHWVLKKQQFRKAPDRTADIWARTQTMKASSVPIGAIGVGSC